MPVVQKARLYAFSPECSMYRVITMMSAHVSAVRNMRRNLLLSTMCDYSTAPEVKTNFLFSAILNTFGSAILGDRLMVGQQPLKLCILVRVQVPQQKNMKYTKGKTGKDFIKFIKNSPPDSTDAAYLFGNLNHLKEGDPEQTDNFEIKYWAFTNSDEPSHKPKTQRESKEYNFIITGKVEGNIGGEPITLETGDYVIIPPGVESNLIEKVVEDVVGITIKSPSIRGDQIRA